MMMNIKYLSWQFIIYCRLPRVLKKIDGGGNFKYKYHLLSSATLLMHDEIKRKKCKYWWVYYKKSIKY